MPPPTISTAQFSGKPSPEMASVLDVTGNVEPQSSVKRPWEEPHPGQRLAHVTGRAQPAWRQWGQGELGSPQFMVTNGECRDGMAAKGASPHHFNRSWLVRRSIRMRNRMSVP